MRRRRMSPSMMVVMSMMRMMSWKEIIRMMTRTIIRMTGGSGRRRMITWRSMSRSQSSFASGSCGGCCSIDRIGSSGIMRWRRSMMRMMRMRMILGIF